MAAIRMTSLRRSPNGDWLARKMIPEDVRAGYKATFGVSQEARFRAPASTRADVAKQAFRDWDAEVTSRIERLRAQARGEGLPTLTHRQSRALAGDWYVWFVGQNEEEPGTSEQWDLMADEYETSFSRFVSADSDLNGDREDATERSPVVRRSVHRALVSLGRVDEFLHERNVVLADEAKSIFLGALEGDFLPALATLRRRADGNYEQDKRREGFPTVDPNIARQPVPEGIKPSGLTVWAAFELWIAERKPAASSVNRWRAVFNGLRETFGDRDLASITAKEARGWIDGLTTANRSAHVANDVWLRAVRTVFRWAVNRNRLASDPFAGATVALPKKLPRLREREFHEIEWRTILSATLKPPPARMEPHNAAARRWVPWLCAYTGSRPGEACQLRAEDIQRHRDGFWTINITPEAGTVKGNVARVVPLHEHLVEQGFVAFAQMKRKGPLFYDPGARRKTDTDPTNPTRQPWTKARDKLSEWVRSLGVADPGISPNHAWRHTFKRRAARADIERRIRFAMCGHMSKDEGDAYETPSVEDLATEGRKFPRYGLD
jgi:integrase